MDKTQILEKINELRQQTLNSNLLDIELVTSGVSF